MVYISLPNKKGIYFDEFPFKKNRKPSIEYFFLSHAHSDHTKGISSIKYHPDLKIVCTRSTSIFVQHFHKVPKEKFLIVSNGQSLDFDDYTVHVLDANHCLGSSMFVIERKDGFKEIFTGDFRYNPDKFPEIGLLRNSDRMWLDFTYGKDPRFRFPSREEVTSEIISLILSSGKFEMNDYWLSAYKIGREHLLSTLSKALKTKIWAPPPKAEIYREIGGEFDIFTDKESILNVHSRTVVENLKGIDTILQKRIETATRISLSGWTVIRRKQNPNVFYFEYSDHNDYNSLQEWLKKTTPQQIEYI